MAEFELKRLLSAVQDVQTITSIGRVAGIDRGSIEVTGLSGLASLGDQVEIERPAQPVLTGEVIKIMSDVAVVMPDQLAEGVIIGGRVTLRGPISIAPDDSWIGRVVDPFGNALDGRPIMRGEHSRPLNSAPPKAIERKAFGARLETGMAAFNTLLPLVKGQRIGLFAGSGVGKSTLLARFAQGVQADVVVIAMVGERGREVREFVDHVLGAEGMARAVIVAATSDQSPLMRRRCALSAMTIAEHFRDQGAHVLLLTDSITRFAEAHREVALASGEAASYRGYPPSTAHLITSLCERAGCGSEQQGDITAVFSILVAGSDMEEPIADILRGVLDGHVVLDRKIAERGRFPAVDFLRSVSRSLPNAATKSENQLISRARQLLGAYDRGELMIQAGLYVSGSDPLLDTAITAWPSLDTFLSDVKSASIDQSFVSLAGAISPVDKDEGDEIGFTAS